MTVVGALKSIIIISVPIVLQGLLTASLGFIDLLMISQFGEISVSIVGINNQLFFLHLVVVFSVASGVLIFAVQSFSASDKESCQEYFSIGLLIGSFFGVVFFLFSFLFPSFFIRLYLDDDVIVGAGSEYMRAHSFVYLLFFVSAMFTFMLRSVGKVYLPLIASSISVVVNTFLNYLLIFGNFGFPEFGVQGAVYATLISRVLEVSVIIFLAYYYRSYASITLCTLFLIRFDSFLRYMKIVTPIFVTSLLWVVGSNVYAAIYARDGLEAFSAYNVAMSIEKIGLVIISSLSTGCAIFIGNLIGEDKDYVALKMSNLCVVMSLVCAIFISFFVLFSYPLFTGLYNFSDYGFSYLNSLVVVVLVVFVLKSINITINTGLLRSGGDTKYSMYLDLLPMWLLGIPLAAFCVLYFGLPIYFAMIFVSMEELIKLFFGLRRLKSGKWMAKLV